MRRLGIALLVGMLAVGGRAWTQPPPPPPPPPPGEGGSIFQREIRFVRAPHPVAGSILVEQPNFPAEITRAYHNDSNWLSLARASSRTAMEITELRLGWAYALPSGLEFHQTDAITPAGGLSEGGWYETESLQVKPRADALYLVTFVEQVTLKNGVVLNADHGQISGFYRNCCTGANAGDEPEIPQVRVQPDMPGGALPLDWRPDPELKIINFDVVLFRRAEQPGRGREFPDDGDFISYHGSTIHDLLLFAYEGGRQGYFTISGEPDWVKNDFFEFTAKVAPEDVAEWKSMQLIDKRYMVARLLERTLNVKQHTDTSEHPVYELVVAKGGPKLMHYHAGDTVKDPGGRALTGRVAVWFDPFRLVCQDTMMVDLANQISAPNRAGRVVIDKTGLKGTYNFMVPVPVAEMPEQLRQQADDAGVPSMFEGFKQLGLQLVPAKDPIRGIVIDAIDRPPEN